MRKRTMGYYYRTGSESLRQASAHCYDCHEGLALFKTPKRVQKQIDFDRKEGLIGSKAKTIIFKVLWEELA